MKNRVTPPSYDQFGSFPKRYLLGGVGLVLAGLLSGSAHAQLLHRYSFTTDASDSIGGANGALEGTATVSGGGLVTTGAAGGLSGGVPQNSAMLPASAVAGITGPFTIESWFAANYNGGFCTAFSFSDGTTANYVLATPARGNSPYASSISVIGGGGSTSEQQAAEQYQDNGLLHDMVVTYNGTSLSYYIDGALGSYSGLPNTITDPGLNLSTLTNIGVNGGSPYSDNTIKGTNYDFRIYGQALTPAQVAALYALGKDASSSAISNAIAPPTAFTWNGAGANDNWSTALNWVGGSAPTASGNSITFAGSTRTTPNLEANYSVTGLTFTNNTGSFTLGTANSSTLTLQGDVVNDSANVQTLNVPIALAVAASLNAASNSFVVNSNLTVNSPLTLSGNNNFTLNGNISGNGSFVKNGTGTLTLGGSSLSAGNVTFNNGTSLIAGTVSSAGGITRIGYLTGNGVVNITGTTWNIGGEIQVGGSDTSGSSIVGTGVFNVNGGTVYAGSLTLARGNYLDNNESGTLNLKSGSTFISTNDVILQFAGQGLGKLAMNGSTFIVGPTGTRWFMVGYYDTGAGEVDITNANLLLENGTSLKMCRNGNSGANVINQVGNSSVTFYSDAGVTVGGGGNLDLSYAGGGSSSSTYNLIGGTLTVPQITASTSSGSSTFDFDGGTVKPTASTTAFMQGLSVAYVFPGGAVIDTAGHDITIAQPLANGGGGLTKKGAGTLTLSGGYYYAGTTLVQAGILALDAGQASSGSALTVNHATLSLSLNNGNSAISASTVTFSGSSVLNLYFGTASSPGAAAIYASAVSQTGTTVINITGQNLVVGTYPLISTGGSVPTTGFSLGSLPTGVTAHLNNSGTSLDLVITAAGQSLTWYGANNSGNPLTTWDINNSMNWNAGAAKYLQYGGNSYGDNVTFDDNVFSPADANITLNTTVVPASVTFNNSSTPYSITGSGGIGGGTAVVVGNNGSVFLGTANSYTGGTTIGGGGTLTVTNNSALGASSGTVTLEGGTLQFSNSASIARSISVISNSTINLAPGANVQLSGTLSGSANLSVDGPGTLTLAGSATTEAVTVGGAVGNSVMNVSGTLTASNLFIGNVSGAASAVFQTGGFVSLNGGTGDNLSVGNWDGSFGYFGVAGGTMNINGINIGGEENPNVWPPAGGGDGIMEVNGATINNAGWIVMARGSGPNTGILNVYSGSLTYSGGGIGCNWNGNATTVTGTQTSIINVLGGSVTSTNQGVNFRSDGNIGILNLNGGLLSGTGVGGFGTVNFNGGTLQPCANFGNPFLNVSSNVYVYGGGARIDDNGQSLTISQPFLAPTGSGISGPVVISDHGSGYISPPIVTISGDGYGATAIAQIDRSVGTVTNVLITCPGVDYTAAFFAFSGGGAISQAAASASTSANVSGGLTKLGNGTLTLSGVNTYTGPTVVSAGTLAGTSTLAGALINNATLAPGAAGLGALIVNGNITLNAGSTNVFAVDGTTPANSSVVAGGTVTYGGTLRLVPSGSFTVGQQFHLLSGTGATTASKFSAIQGSPGNGLAFAFTNGILSVVTGTASNPTNITYTVSGGAMRLSWPTDHMGWLLQIQTNSLGKGLSTNWVDVPGTGSVTSTNIPINPAIGSEFFRLRHP